MADNHAKRAVTFNRSKLQDAREVHFDTTDNNATAQNKTTVNVNVRLGIKNTQQTGDDIQEQPIQESTSSEESSSPEYPSADTATPLGDTAPATNQEYSNTVDNTNERNTPEQQPKNKQALPSTDTKLAPSGGESTPDESKNVDPAESLANGDTDIEKSIDSGEDGASHNKSDDERTSEEAVPPTENEEADLAEENDVEEEEEEHDDEIPEENTDEQQAQAQKERDEATEQLQEQQATRVQINTRPNTNQEGQRAAQAENQRKQQAALAQQSQRQEQQQLERDLAAARKKKSPLDKKMKHLDKKISGLYKKIGFYSFIVIPFLVILLLIVIALGLIAFVITLGLASVAVIAVITQVLEWIGSTAAKIGLLTAELGASLAEKEELDKKREPLVQEVRQKERKRQLLIARAQRLNASAR